MGKTTAEKLLIKPGTTVWLSDEAHQDRLGPLPDGAAYTGEPGHAAVGVVFADAAAAARAVLDKHRDHLTAPAVMWVAYRKGGRSDINRDTLWPIVLEYGLRPNGQVAIDEEWSALRFRPLKPGETFQL